MSENMKIWNALRTPPASALKKIQAGRLKGMSDISPQWRYEAMTMQFGPCGVGWKYEIVKFWTEPGSEEQVMCFADINLFFKEGDNWSAPVPGVGGSMLVTKESKGLHTSDEGYKMALTDALSVAMKLIGVAADVYSGKADDSKYSKQEAPSKPASTDNKKRLAEMAINIREIELPAELSAWWSNNGKEISFFSKEERNTICGIFAERKAEVAK